MLSVWKIKPATIILRECTNVLLDVWRNPQNTSVSTAAVRTDIPIKDLPNTSHRANHYNAPLEPDLSRVSAMRDERRKTSEWRHGLLDQPDC